MIGNTAEEEKLMQIESDKNLSKLQIEWIRRKDKLLIHEMFKITRGITKRRFRNKRRK